MNRSSHLSIAGPAFLFRDSSILYIFGFSVPAYIASKSWVKILAKFEPKQETQEEEDFSEITEE